MFCIILLIGSSKFAALAKDRLCTEDCVNVEMTFILHKMWVR